MSNFPNKSRSNFPNNRPDDICERTPFSAASVLARPFVILKAALSLDGYIDDSSDERLILSTEGDRAEILQLRASVDAILVGANTLRKDNPSLDAAKHHHTSQVTRTAPLKVTLSESGNISPDAKFFSEGNSAKLVYTTTSKSPQLKELLGSRAQVIPIGESVELVEVLADLSRRGVARLLVEGGAHIIQAFLEQELVDELRLAISPQLVSDETAVRFLPRGAKAISGDPWFIEKATMAHGMLVVELSSKCQKPSP